MTTPKDKDRIPEFLKTDNLKVNSFCQSLNENGNWVDQKVKKDNNIQLENAILNQAKKIKLSQS